MFIIILISLGSYYYIVMTWLRHSFITIYRRHTICITLRFHAGYAFSYIEIG